MKKLLILSLIMALIILNVGIAQTNAATPQYYYYSKYNVDTIQVYQPGNTWTFKNSDTSTIEWAYFPTYTFDETTGLYKVYNESGVYFPPTGGGASYTLVPKDGKTYSIYQYLDTTAKNIRRLDMYYSNKSGTGMFYIDVYHLSPSTITNKKVQGSFIQGDIKAIDGTYPDNGIHSDGFWYVKKTQVPNTAPMLVVNQNDIRVNNNGTVTISGTIRDVDNDDVTISAVLDGKTKQTTITNTSSTKTWSLTWSGSELAEGTYSNIQVTASDGK